MPETAAQIRPELSATTTSQHRELYIAGGGKKGEAFGAAKQAIKEREAQRKNPALKFLFGMVRPEEEQRRIGEVQQAMEQNGIIHASTEFARAVMEEADVRERTFIARRLPEWKFLGLAEIRHKAEEKVTQATAKIADAAIPLKEQTRTEAAALRALAEAGISSERKFVELPAQENTPLGNAIRDIIRKHAKTGKFGASQIRDELRVLTQEQRELAKANSEEVQNELSQFLQGASRKELYRIARDLREIAREVAQNLQVHEDGIANIDIVLTNLTKGDKKLEDYANTQAIFAAAKMLRTAVMPLAVLGIAANPFTAVPAALSLGYTAITTFWARYRENAIARQMHQKNLTRPNGAPTSSDKKGGFVSNAAGALFGKELNPAKYNYEQEKAITLLVGSTDKKGVQQFLEEGALTEADRQAALTLMADIDARIDVSLGQNVQMIDFSDMGRARFLARWAENRVKLQEKIQAAGLSGEEFQKAYAKMLNRAQRRLGRSKRISGAVFATRSVTNAMHNAAGTTLVSFAFGYAGHLLQGESVGEYLTHAPSAQIAADNIAGCFVAGTLILMSDGKEKKIEEIQVGEKVYSYDEEKKEIVSSEVLQIFAPMHTHLVRLAFSNGIVSTNTPNHRYLTKEKGWASVDPLLTQQRDGVLAEKLEKDDTVFTYSNGKLEEIYVTEITEIVKECQTYNLSHIKDTHTFFANGVLVHNVKSGESLQQAQPGYTDLGWGEVPKWTTPHNLLDINGWKPYFDNNTFLAGGIGDFVEPGGIVGSAWGDVYNAFRGIPQDVEHWFGAAATQHAASTEKSVSINSLFQNNKPESAPSYAGNHFYNIDTSQHPEDSPDNVLGSWQTAHTGYDSNGQWVDFYTTYSGAHPVIEVNGHWYWFDGGKVGFNDNPMVLHAVNGGGDVTTMTQHQFLQMEGYGDPNTIRADAIAEQTYQQWASIHGVTGTQEASDRLAQLSDPAWLARHPGFEQLLQQNLDAHHLSLVNIHYNATAYGAGVVEGNHLNMIASDQYTDSRNFQSVVGGAGFNPGSINDWQTNGANELNPFVAQPDRIVAIGLMPVGAALALAVTRGRFLTYARNNAIGLGALGVVSVLMPGVGIPLAAGYLGTSLVGMGVNGVGKLFNRGSGKTGGGKTTTAKPAATTKPTTKTKRAKQKKSKAPTPVSQNFEVNTYASVPAGVLPAAGAFDASLGGGAAPANANTNLATELGITNQTEVDDAVHAATTLRDSFLTTTTPAQYNIHFEDAAAQLVQNVPAGFDLTQESNALALARILLPGGGFTNEQLHYLADAIRLAHGVMIAVDTNITAGNADLNAVLTAAFHNIGIVYGIPITVKHAVYETRALWERLIANQGGIHFTLGGNQATADQIAHEIINGYSRVKDISPEVLAVVGAVANQGFTGADPALERLRKGFLAAGIEFSNTSSSNKKDTLRVAQALYNGLADDTMHFGANATERKNNILGALVARGLGTNDATYRYIEQKL